jgi:hypothetical protein
MRTRTSPVTGPSRPTSLRRTLVLVVGLVMLLAQSAPAAGATTQTWAKNLYTSKAFLYQDPYGTACTAASTMIMLNTIAYRRSGGAGFGWTPYRVKNNTANRADKRDMTSILWFARAHDTLAVGGAGSDGHGWRNALNYYGWGYKAMIDPASNVYDDLEFTSYDAAVHAAVRAIARFGMPVGIVTWAGRHAQVMTGYVVTGADPATSDAFSVESVYLTDPLRKDRVVNMRISNRSFRIGTLRIRFQSYRETDSPYDDGYKPGWKRSAVSPLRGPSEWYHRWVILAPVRAGLTTTPAPTPSPSPTPSPTTAPATPSPTPTAAPASPSPSSGPTASPTASPTPTAAPATSAPAPESSVAP